MNWCLFYLNKIGFLMKPDDFELCLLQTMLFEFYMCGYAFINGRMMNLWFPTIKKFLNIHPSFSFHLNF